MKYTINILKGTKDIIRSPAPAVQHDCSRESLVHKPAPSTGCSSTAERERSLSTASAARRLTCKNRHEINGAAVTGLARAWAKAGHHTSICCRPWVWAEIRWGHRGRSDCSRPFCPGRRRTSTWRWTWGRRDGRSSRAWCPKPLQWETHTFSHFVYFHTY